ncbi:Crp/Fnr family transcriptional regulator [Thiospirochaeta perfilievii]|uniref:Crp/Fnr family transcriptional regulator n=1 Tax=Thiospirochaeta perfilievii TaxID=252967 RepID=A0A5C1QBB4_9SPIO|nr:Crp/Fnr family transcriptional regulator [Thiospirochaeta perfilievii]QEN05345.1 Crp/Fnr family transcriptional regulator [Thiospirochaeta perfilievii]
MNKRTWNDSIFENGIEKKYSKCDVIHTSEDICYSMGRVESGSVKICRVLPSGKEIVLKEITAGETYAELIVFLNINYPGWIIAKEETVVKEISEVKIFEYLKMRENLESFLYGISNKMLGLTDKIELLSFKTLKQKLIFLITKNNNLTIKEVVISDLASSLGCSREALSRSISDLVSEGVISHKNNEIRIINEDKLDKIFI